MRKPGVKYHSLTVGLRREPRDLSYREETRIPGVGVKSVDIWKNTKGEGKLLDMD